MKKLAVMLGVASLAITLKAASANWMIDLGEDTYDTWSFYVFNGTTATTLAGYLTGDQVSSFTTAIASYTAVTLDTGYADGIINDAESTFSAILYNTTDNGATFYYIGSDSTDGFTYAPPASAPGELYWELSNFTSATVVNTGSTPTPGSVPEPTSGLLMVLGLAGLALRRRRA